MDESIFRQIICIDGNGGFLDFIYNNLTVVGLPSIIKNGWLEYLALNRLPSKIDRLLCHRERERESGVNFFYLFISSNKLKPMFFFG